MCIIQIVTDDTKGPRDEQEPAAAVEKKDDEVEVEEVAREPLEAADGAAGDTSAADSSLAPAAAAAANDNSDDDEYDSDDSDYEDETVLERIQGLAEMFPDSVRNGSCALASGSVGALKWLYSTSRTVSWVVFSSSAILFMPIMIETERMGIEEMQKQQQRQILLGPGAAVSGNAPLPSM